MTTTSYFTKSTDSLPDTVSYVYMMVAISIASYLFGAYSLASFGLSFFAMIVSFILIVPLVLMQKPYILFLLAFCLGVSNSQFFQYINYIDPSLIHEALVATCMVFAGLTYLAYNTPGYASFAFYGFLYSSLSTMIWLGLANLFFQNSLVELLLTYFGIMVFSGFIIVDTHELIKNPTCEPVLHATNLFLDFISMFIRLVKLLKHLKNK